MAKTLFILGDNDVGDGQQNDDTDCQFSDISSTEDGNDLSMDETPVDNILYPGKKNN